MANHINVFARFADSDNFCPSIDFDCFYNVVKQCFTLFREEFKMSREIIIVPHTTVRFRRLGKGLFAIIIIQISEFKYFCCKCKNIFCKCKR